MSVLQSSNQQHQQSSTTPSAGNKNQLSFSIMAPAVWNSLSSVTKSSATITTFKAHLKTELFQLHTIWSNASSAAGTPSSTLDIRRIKAMN